MRIGVDFDNTIVCYDPVFHHAALKKNLIPKEVPANKQAVRDYLREHGQEETWIELQGYVYGACMPEAKPFPGALDFFRQCKKKDIEAFIISHKTRGPFRGPHYDFHQASRNWLESYGFCDPSQIGMNAGQIFFELTKEEKLARIAKSGCTHFIDDLPEFLLESDFPPGIRRILFNPGVQQISNENLETLTSWEQISERLMPKSPNLSSAR